jgi:hypothetical protein
MAYEAIHTVFPNLREVVGPDYQSLPDPELGEAVAEVLGMPAEIAENWLANLGRTLAQRAPAILSGAVQGGVAGAPFGGPLGAGVGALFGGITGALTGGPRPGAPAAPGAAPGPAQPVPVGPRAPGVPAAGALLQLFANPDAQRALMSMLLGPKVGAPNVSVGGTAVPVADMAELIRAAAERALVQYELADEEWETGDEAEYREADRRRRSKGDPFLRGVVVAKLLDQPTYVPAAPTPPMAPTQPTVVYPPATGPPPGPAAPAPTPAAPPAMPAAPEPPPGADPGFEPTPQYGTPDLGIGQPIPTEAFEETLDSIFELDEVES